MRAFERLDALEKQRKRIPRRVPVQDVVAGNVVRFSIGPEHPTNAVRMVAHKMEYARGRHTTAAATTEDARSSTRRSSPRPTST